MRLRITPADIVDARRSDYLWTPLERAYDRTFSAMDKSGVSSGITHLRAQVDTEEVLYLIPKWAQDWEDDFYAGKPVRPTAITLTLA